MIIAVQRGMFAIKEQLESKGHKVVYSDEYTHPIDAVITKGGRNEFSYSPPAGIVNSIAHGNRFSGAVMEINAEGKSIKDIEMMLYCKRHGNTDILS